MRYTIAMVIGCIAWAVIYATVGIAAVEAAIALAAHSPWALAAAIVLIAVLVAAIVVWRLMARRSAGRPAR